MTPSAHVGFRGEYARALFAMALFGPALLSGAPTLAATLGQPMQLLPPAALTAPLPNSSASTFSPDAQTGPAQQFLPPQPKAETKAAPKTEPKAATTATPTPTPRPAAKAAPTPVKATPPVKSTAPTKPPVSAKSTLPGVRVVPNQGPLIAPKMMSAAQKDTLQRISANFNAIRTMKGQFVQIGPNREQSEGEFYLSRPGKIRFHYLPPVRVNVISDGRSVAVEDRSAQTQNIYPLSKTPLKHLLAERVDLTSDSVLSGYREDSDTVSLVLAEAALGDGLLTLMFDRANLQLRQWVIADARGQETAVAVYNVEIDKPVDAQIFTIQLTQDFR